MRRCLWGAWAAVGLGCGRIGFDARATPDAIDAADGFVDVTTSSRNGAAPKPMVAVWTSRRDGSVDDVQLTDAAGAAHLHLEAGGAVSAAYSPAQEFVVATWNIHSILDAEPGDQLSFGGSPTTCGTTTRGTATLTFPAYAGASFYELVTPCSTAFVSSSPYVWTLPADLPDPGDVIVVAFGTGGTVIGSASQFDVALPDGATPTLVAGDWHAAPSVSIGATGLPPAMTRASVSGYFLLPSKDVVVTTGYAGDVATAGGAVSAPLPVPLEATRTRIVVRATDPTRAFGVDLESAAGAPTVTAMPSPPPSIDTPMFAPATRAITWNEGTSPNPGDRVESLLGLQATTGDGIGWSVWAPATATALVLPELPPSIAAWDPANAVNQVTPTVMIVDQLDVTGWRSARTAPEWDSPMTHVGHAHVATIATRANGL